MSMTTCRECKASVADSAERCPHCGVGDPDRIRHYAKTVAGLVVLLVIGFCVVGAIANVADDSSSEIAAAPRPNCQVKTTNIKDDAFLINGEMDYGYIVSADILNVGESGDIAITARLTSSEGELVRQRTERIAAEAVSTLQFQFSEPTVNASDVRFHVTCGP